MSDLKVANRVIDALNINGINSCCVFTPSEIFYGGYFHNGSEFSNRVNDKWSAADDYAKRFDERYPDRRILMCAIDVLRSTNEYHVRMVLKSSNRTIHSMRIGDYYLSLLMPTGHAVTKSIQRKVRRVAKDKLGLILEPDVKSTSCTIPAAAQPSAEPPAVSSVVPVMDIPSPSQGETTSRTGVSPEAV